MRKIIAYVATSADGFLARPDGDVGWLNRPEPRGGYGMLAFYRSVDTVLLGRKTYEMGRRLGQDSFPGKRNLVFSRRLRRLGGSGVELVKEDPAVVGERLRRGSGKHVWLVGGAELIGAFLDAGQLDELIVHVIPVLIGEGIPLVAPRHRTVPLELLGSRGFSDGVVRLHYSVRRPARSAARRQPAKAKARSKRRTRVAA